MFAKINHVAIVSEKYALLASFYQSLFGMKRSPKGKINRAITVGDGYVGLNINPRKPGRPAGLDHFGVEVENDGSQNERHISHVAMRTLRPDEMARFYADVLQLSEQNAKAGDPNHYLTDGKMTLMIMPWHIKNYSGQSILPTGMDHVGFTVESVDKLKEDVDEMVGVNPVLNPIPVGKGKESGARLELLKRQCPIGEYFLSDPDFTMIAVRAAH